MKNVIEIGDTEYEIDRAYVKGALACRNGVRWDNDHSLQWQSGHVNESAGEHIRFGKDCLSLQENGARILEDPLVPRDKNGVVDYFWYQKELDKLSAERGF